MGSAKGIVVNGNGVGIVANGVANGFGTGIVANVKRHRSEQNMNRRDRKRAEASPVSRWERIQDSFSANAKPYRKMRRNNPRGNRGLFS
nr:hypothetical protein CFP56_30461 [Quercus suber]